MSAFLGGTRSPELALASTARQEALVLRDLRDLLGVSGKPAWQHIVSWPQAIPQYTVGYGNFMEAIAESEKAYPGLKFLGNYRSGVALSQCLLSGLQRG